MKLLIIGAKGFIGHHAFSYFSSVPDVECWGTDVVSDYTTARYICVDGINSDYNELFETGLFDVCINCSGAASVPDSMQHPLRDFTLNTHNVIKILDAIRKHSPTCKFINLSSAAVYGNPVRLPIKESDPSCPVSPYGQHKYFAEEICREYYHYFNLQTCSLRIFSAYGPGLQKQILWDMFVKASKGVRIELFGTGNETRDFIYVHDIVRAISVVINKGDFGASVYNIASGTEVSIKKICKQMLKQIKFAGVINFCGEERPGDPTNWVADITKIKKMGFEVSVSLEDGIENYVKWLREKKLL